MDSEHGRRLSGQHKLKGWHSRGYLPHIDAAKVVQFVTFRLADSVPRTLIDEWRLELNCNEHAENVGTTDNAAKLQRRIEKYADTGHGACPLAQPENARVVRDALLHFDGARYQLLAWCIMPNHVHVLIDLHSQSWPLPAIVQSWKSWTARAINRNLDRSGRLWMPDYFDRYVRDEAHLKACIHYIRQNPVQVGLVANANDWPWTGP